MESAMNLTEEEEDEGDAEEKEPADGDEGGGMGQRNSGKVNEAKDIGQGNGNQMPLQMHMRDLRSSASIGKTIKPTHANPFLTTTVSTSALCAGKVLFQR